MTLDKWKEIVGQIKDNFEVESHESYHLEDQGGMEVEDIVFQSPLGKTKLEFISKPLLLDKKTSYSKRLGSDVKIENVYSQEEKVYNMNAYKWDEEAGDWLEIDSKNFDL